MTNPMFDLNLSWYHILGFLLVTYYISNKVHEQYLYRKLKCKPLKANANDGTLGLKTVYNLLVKGPDVYTLEENKDHLNQFGTFYSRIITQSVVYTKSSDNIKAILATQFEEFGLSDRFKQFKPFLGKSIFTTDGAAWKDSRALVRPQFTREQIAHVQSLETHILGLAKHIKNHKGQPFEFNRVIFKYTYDTATEFLFGESEFSLRDESIGYPTNVDAKDRMKFARSVKTAAVYSGIRALIQSFYWLVNPKKYKDACKFVHDFVGKKVSNALALNEKEFEEKSKGGYYILYELIKATKDPTVIREQLLSLFLAGRYTTAGSIAFLFWELGKRPDVLKKLKEEIYNTFDKGEDSRVSDITFESLKRCSYLQAVINESLRMWPVVPQNARVANRDTTLPRGGGKDGQESILIRKGQTVFWSTYAIQRDENIYGKDSNTFRPERWLEPSMPKLSWVYMPFGGGPRICLGQQFALTEVAYTTVRLLQLFENIVGAPSEDKHPDASAALTLTLKSVVLSMS